YSAKQFLSTGWPLVGIVVAWTLVDGQEDDGEASRGRSARLPAAICVSIVAAVVTVATQRADWRGTVQYLNARTDRTNAVWIDPPWNAMAYDFYHPAIAATTNGSQTTGSNGRRSADSGDVCLVAERFGATPPTSASEAWLDQHFHLADTRSVARLQVRCYTTHEIVR